MPAFVTNEHRVLLPALVIEQAIRVERGTRRTRRCHAWRRHVWEVQILSPTLRHSNQKAVIYGEWCVWKRCGPTLPLCCSLATRLVLVSTQKSPRAQPFSVIQGLHQDCHWWVR
jgi:hypothetical protein